jgi:hypothetical protein
MSKETLLLFLNIGKGLALSALPPPLAQIVQRVEKEIWAEAKNHKTTPAQWLEQIGINLDGLDKETDTNIAKADRDASESKKGVLLTPQHARIIFRLREADTKLRPDKISGVGEQ